MKQLLTSLSPILAFFLLLFLYTKLLGPIPFSVNNINTNKTDGFSVTGTGKASASPDSASVTVGVNATAPTTQAAQSQMNESINKVSAAIKALGINAADIKTENYNVNPLYDYQSGAQKITSYQANTNIKVTIKDISKVNQVIDEATKNGANQVGGVAFDNKDNSSAENTAREMAVKDAKGKAEQAAKIAGFKLGKVINYSENLSGETMPIAYGRASNALDMKAVSPPTQVDPGSNDVVISVTLSYEVI